MTDLPLMSYKMSKFCGIWTARGYRNNKFVCSGKGFTPEAAKRACFMHELDKMINETTETSI